MKLEIVEEKPRDISSGQFKEGVACQSSAYCVRITSTTMQTSTKIIWTFEHLTSLALISSIRFLKLVLYLSFLASTVISSVPSVDCSLIIKMWTCRISCNIRTIEIFSREADSSAFPTTHASNTNLLKKTYNFQSRNSMTPKLKIQDKHFFF